MSARVFRPYTRTLGTPTTALALVLLTACATTDEWIDQGAAPLSGATIASIAAKNLGEGPCSTNSAGGSGFYTSCGQAWCADFARWVWAQAGVSNTSELTPAAGSFYVYGANHGTLHSTPQVGDAVVFNYGYQGTGTAEHVALVTKVNSDGTIESISGNWGNRVTLNVPAYSPSIGSTPSTMGQKISGFVSPVGVTSGGGGGGGGHVGADVDGDGHADLVAVTGGHAYAYKGQSSGVFLDGGDSFAGTLGDRRAGSAAGWWLIDAADVTGDGHADLVGLHAGGTAMVWPGQSNLDFGASASSFAGTMTLATAQSPGFDPIAVADVTGDGRADLVAAHTDGDVYVYPGEASGAFAYGVTTGNGGFDWALHDGTGHWPVGVADVTGDGRADLVTMHSDGDAYVYVGQADGHFTGPVASFAGTMHPTLADGRPGHEPIGVADVTGDGHADLVTLAEGTAHVYPGTASGAFSGAALSFAGTMTSARLGGSGFDAAAVLDVTGDGHADLLAGRNDGDIYLYPGTPSGTFSPYVTTFHGTFHDALFGGGQGLDIVSQSLSVRRAVCSSGGCRIP